MTLKFTQKETTYIKSQPLARIGTASQKGNPDVAAVGFDFDGEYFYVSGYVLERTHKYKNVLERTHKYKNVLENPSVSLVIDDLETVKPWRPRGIKVRGTADLVDHKGYMGPRKYIRIKPTFKTSWGIEKQIREH